MASSSTPPPVNVSQRASQAYADRLHQLVALVDGELAARPDIGALLGHNPFSVAHAHHENFGRFVAAVLAFQGAGRLERALPWGYGSYHAHGFSYDYFPVELAAWERAVASVLPAEDAAEVVPLFRWMIARHEANVALAETAPAGSSPGEGPMADDDRSFLFALVRGDHREASRLALERVAGPEDLARFYVGTVQRCLGHVGSLWERGVITVPQEHLASAAVGNVMAALYGRFLTSGGRRGVAVVTAVSGEFHEIGGRMVADLLEVDGWDVRYLGVNTPPEELGALCASERAALLALSVTMHFNLRAAEAIVEAVRRLSPSTRILVGGRAFADSEDLWRALGADACARDASGAVEVARTWRGEG